MGKGWFIGTCFLMCNVFYSLKWARTSVRSAFYLC